MIRNFDDLLDIFGNTGKVLEMTTKGRSRNAASEAPGPTHRSVSRSMRDAAHLLALRNDVRQDVMRA
jgi:hypothetical protein